MRLRSGSSSWHAVSVRVTDTLSFGATWRTPTDAVGEPPLPAVAIGGDGPGPRYEPDLCRHQRHRSHLAGFQIGVL